MKNKKRFVPWLIAAVIIAAFAVIGKKLYDLMFGGSLAVTTEDLKNGIIACSPAIIFIVVVLIAALIVVVAAGKLKQPKRALVRAQAPIAILLAITLSVNWVILGVEYSVVNSVFAEDVKVSDETMASGRAIADQIASEGIVLLKNDDKALPLSAGTKLNLFGWSSVRPLYGGTGSGDSDTSNAVSLIDGLKHAGFEVNEELVKFYENFRTERPVGTIRLREIGSKRGDFTVPEPTIAEYENANIFEDAVPHTTANQCLKLVTLLYNKSQSGTRAVNTLNIIPITKRKFPKYFFQRLQIKADLRLSLQAFLSIGGGIVNRRSGGVPSPKVLHCVYLSAAMAALQGMMLCEFLHDVRFW